MDAEQWCERIPALTEDVHRDRRAVERYATAVEEHLDSLPSPERRTPEHRAHARQVRRACDGLRARFLALHAERVHSELADGAGPAGARGHRPGLEGLADAAGGAFPGLLPDRDRLDAEQRLALADKEGLDVALGVFFQALLRSRTGGSRLMERLLRPTPRARDLLSGFRREGRADLGAVSVERRDGAGHLTVHQPQSLNAENNGFVAAMETAVDLVLLDEGVRVGVLRGGRMVHPRYAGRRVFSSGINLKDLYHGRISYLSFFLRRELGFVHKLMRGLVVANEAAWPGEVVTKPWLAVVDSFAIGGGAQLLFLFDYVLAGADSYISLPAAQEGIVPGGANLRLGRRGDSRLARQLLLGGRRIRAGEDTARTFFDEVVEPDRLDAAAERALARLDDHAVPANRHLLHLAEEPPHAFQDYMAEYALHQALRVHSPDVVERLARFMERPRPAQSAVPR